MEIDVSQLKQETKDLIVEMLGHRPNITAVARLLGVAPSSVYKAKAEDPEFAAAVNEALEIGVDTLEEEAMRRAVDGVLEPVWFQGMEAGHVRKYSDALLQTLLKAKRPRQYNPGAKVEVDTGEKVKLTINLGGPVDD